MPKFQPAKPGEIVEFLYESKAIEDVRFCDAEAVDEATVTFPRGTVGTVLRVINELSPNTDYILLIEDNAYFVRAKHCRVVTKYEGSIQEEFDKLDKAFEEDI